MKYTHSLFVIESPDARSHGFRFVDHKTGKMAEGLIHAGESNVTASLHRLKLDYTNTLYSIVSPATNKQFKYRTEDMPVISESPDCIALYVRLAFKLEKKKFLIAKNFALNTVQLAMLFRESDAIEICKEISRQYQKELTIKQGARLLAFLNRFRG